MSRDRRIHETVKLYGLLFVSLSNSANILVFLFRLKLLIVMIFVIRIFLSILVIFVYI